MLESLAIVLDPVGGLGCVLRRYVYQWAAVVNPLDIPTHVIDLRDASGKSVCRAGRAQRVHHLVAIHCRLSEVDDPIAAHSQICEVSERGSRTRRWSWRSCHDVNRAIAVGDLSLLNTRGS